MKKSVLALVAAFGVALLLGSFARADEKPVKENEVPKACIDAVKKKYPSAEMKAFSKEEEDGKVSYEVQIEVKVKGKDKAGDKVRKIDVGLSPEGKIVSEEEMIGKDELPEKVKKGLETSKYAKWDVKSVERIVHDEKDADASYEIILTSGEKKSEVVFDKDGKITKEEEKKPKAKGEKEGD